MIDRIKQLIEFLQLSPSVFADTIGISRSGLTHLLTGRNQPSLDVARKILAKFPEISTEWLIMGMGDMLRPEEQQSAALDKETDELSTEAYPSENAIIDRQTNLFGEYENTDESVVETDSETDAVQPSQPRPRKTPEVKQATTSAKRDRRLTNMSSEKKLQKIVFFYDDHSFEVYDKL